MVEWVVKPFARDHDRGDFSCGRPALDVFIRTQAGQYEKRQLSRTYVAVRAGEKRVLGYYTLAAGTVARDVLPADDARKLPRHPGPFPD